MGNIVSQTNICCCSSRKKRKEIMKKRITSELEYEREIIEDHAPLNNICSITTTIGAGVAISIAVAPATACVASTTGAVLAVMAATHMIGDSCLNRQRLEDINKELKRRE